MPTNPRLGRPRAAESDLKRNRSIRVQDAKYNDWLARAKRLGISFSAVVEIAVDRELKRLERK